MCGVGMTVKDFIESTLHDKPRDWGKFHVRRQDSPSMLFETCSYSYGTIVSHHLNATYLSAEITDISHNAIGRHSDYWIEVK